MRICPKCNLKKDESEFYGKTNPYCKSCTSSYKKERSKRKIIVHPSIKDLTMREIVETFPKEELDLGLMKFIEKYSREI